MLSKGAEMKFFATGLILLALASGSRATFGVDVSDYFSVSDFSCLVNYHSAKFAIVRAWESLNRPDGNAVQNIKNAKAAGIQYVDGYIFPCYKCGDGAGQVRGTVNNLRDGGASFGTIWLDIEAANYWSSSASSNIAFIQDMLNECSALGVTCGIYSSYYNWQSITGLTHQFANSAQIWYAHYDNTANFDDWSRLGFGGWMNPSIKQYQGDATLCGKDVDLDYY